MPKRLFDIVASAFGLLVLALPMTVIAVLIRLDSPGPAFYLQERIGRGGKPFTMLKFRTMHARDNAGVRVTGRGDPRITKIGASLRRAKVDELPQLINVLVGDMSLVGPRPEVEEYAFLLPEQEQVWQVRPGITDPVSVVFYDEEELLVHVEDPDAYYRTVLLPQKTSLYLEYQKERTMLGDIRVIFDTIARIGARSRPRAGG